MKVRDSHEVSSKQVVAIVAAILVLIGTLIVLLVPYFSTNANATAASAPSTSTTSASARDTFDRPPRHAIVTPIAVTKPKVKPTPKATPKPKPKAVVQHTVVKKKTVVKHYSAPSNGKCGASCQWHKTDSVWKKYPAWVQVFALCVSHHESYSDHMWVAENPISTASGGFQFIDGTFAAWLGRAGLSGNRHAAYNSPIKQASVFAYAVTHGGKKAWHGTNCPGT